MMTATDTRKRAREALAGKWGKGAVITLVFSVISSILITISSNLEGRNIVSLILGLALAIIEIPISYGLIISFIKLKRGEEVGYFDFLKDGFDNFGRAWGIFGNTLLKMIVPIVLMVISAIVILTSLSVSIVDSFYARPSDSWAIILLIAMFVYLIALIYAIVKGLLYAVSNFIAYDNAEMSTKEAVEESAKLMKGKRGSLFVLQLSFIGWGILAALTLGIGFFWLIPYMQVAIVCFYEQIDDKDNKEAEVISSDKE